MHSYPKWLYSKGGSVLVPDEEAHKSLEGDRFESPADVTEPAQESDAPRRGKRKVEQ